jgi:hypothetical protein
VIGSLPSGGGVRPELTKLTKHVGPRGRHGGSFVNFVKFVGRSSSAQWLQLRDPGLPRTTDGRPHLEAPAPRQRDGAGRHRAQRLVGRSSAPACPIARRCPARVLGEPVTTRRGRYVVSRSASRRCCDGSTFRGTGPVRLRGAPHRVFLVHRLHSVNSEAHHE